MNDYSGVEEVDRRWHRRDSRNRQSHLSRKIFRKCYWHKLCNLDKDACQLCSLEVNYKSRGRPGLCWCRTP